MTKETVNHPDHYNGNCSIECIDAIVGMLGIEATVYFCLGNAVKYMWRKDYKGKEEEDMRKASWYLTRAECLALERSKTHNSEHLSEMTERIKNMYKAVRRKDTPFDYS